MKRSLHSLLVAGGSRIVDFMVEGIVLGFGSFCKISNACVCRFLSGARRFLVSYFRSFRVFILRTLRRYWEGSTLCVCFVV